MRVLSDDGVELALATGCSMNGAGTVTIGRIREGKGRLLHYYFGEGRRSVILETGVFKLRATLQTRWLGAERQWLARLAPAPATAA